MLILIIATGTIGINLLSYCCSNKMFESSSSSHNTASCSSHALTSHCSEGQTCCSTSNNKSMSCCSQTTTDNNSNHSLQISKVSRNCSQHQYVQLKPVKTYDYTVSFVAPLPIIIQLFDFNPEISSGLEYPIIVSDSPPNVCGREILAMNAILLI